MKITKSLNGDSIKWIVRKGKVVVFRADSEQEAKDFVLANKSDKKKDDSSEERVTLKDVKKPKKRRSIFKK